MIISASRRTDIPAYYSSWLFQRLRENFALVRNPMNPRQVSRVDLSPLAVDGLVLWTKNPIPMLDKLDGLQDYMYYFQFTLTPYGPDVEPGLPEKTKLLTAFRFLSERLGPERVVWRYDPILLTPRYSWNFHLDAFERMSTALAPYTTKCIFSFLDSYRCISKAMECLEVQWPSPDRQIGMARSLARIAESCGLRLEACAESLNLEQEGIGRARCVDGELLARLLGRPLSHGAEKKAKGQRPACGCAESIDVGAYTTCPSRCLYCYANHSSHSLLENAARHNPASPLLIGELSGEDKVADHSAQRSPKQIKLAL